MRACAGLALRAASAVRTASLRAQHTSSAAFLFSLTTHHAPFSKPNLIQIDSFEREVVEMVKPNHGTTTLGFIFKGGVIIAVDSRATMGSYICEQSNKQAAKAEAEAKKQQPIFGSTSLGGSGGGSSQGMWRARWQRGQRKGEAVTLPAARRRRALAPTLLNVRLCPLPPLLPVTPRANIT